MITLYALMLSCGPKDVPAHLQVDATAGPAAPAAVTNLEQAIARLVANDPLVRRADPATPDTWSALSPETGIATWADVARGTTSGRPDDWTRVERAAPGTAAVPLARGARLAAIEAAFAADATPEAEATVVQWLGVVVPEGSKPLSGVYTALRWLHPGEPEQRREAALVVAERSVLTGWLDGPGIPLAPVAAAMVPGVHDRLIDSPEGALIAASAAGTRNASERADGLAALQKVTELTLHDVLADTDQEQIEQGRRMMRVRSELDMDEPVTWLLERARVGLTADAGDPSSMGLALVAVSASRVLGRCSPGPCGGLDRVASLSAPARWSTDAAPMAATWQVIATKRALDAFEVTWDRPNYPNTVGGVADALVGTGGGPIELSLLVQQRPSSQAFLAWARAAGGSDATDSKGAIRALRAHLVKVCDAALATSLDGDLRTLLTKVRTRAAR